MMESGELKMLPHFKQFESPKNNLLLMRFTYARFNYKLNSVHGRCIQGQLYNAWRLRICAHQLREAQRSHWTLFPKFPKRQSTTYSILHVQNNQPLSKVV